MGWNQGSAQRPSCTSMLQAFQVAVLPVVCPLSDHLLTYESFGMWVAASGTSVALPGSEARLLLTQQGWAGLSGAACEAWPTLQNQPAPRLPSRPTQ